MKYLFLSKNSFLFNNISFIEIVKVYLTIIIIFSIFKYFIFTNIYDFF